MERCYTNKYKNDKNLDNYVNGIALKTMELHLKPNIIEIAYIFQIIHTE